MEKSNSTARFLCRCDDIRISKALCATQEGVKFGVSD
jgi:hypothetical protein